MEGVEAELATAPLTLTYEPEPTDGEVRQTLLRPYIDPHLDPTFNPPRRARAALGARVPRRCACAALGVRPGRAASSRYEYLKGASNGMARGEPTRSAISAEMAGNSAHAPMSPTYR